MNFTSKTDNLVYTSCSIMEIFKKPGLEKKTLGTLLGLTAGPLYHKDAGVKLL